MAHLIAVLLLLSIASCCNSFLQNHPRSTPLSRSAKLSAVVGGGSIIRQQQSLFSSITSLRSTTDDENNVQGAEQDDNNNSGINLDDDSRLYRIRMPRATGIEWGTDLSFSFVYVREMDPTGAASMSGEVAVGDQLCELCAVVEEDGAAAPVNLIGAPFDFVMTTFAELGKTVKDVDLVFFRGTKDDLKAACSGDGKNKESETITITIIENKGSPEETIKTLQAPTGCNVRQVCVDNGINVYQSVTRWTNCKGKQLCGTCIVNIANGAINTNRKSMDEESTLRENPDSYRLSCVTFAYGDVTVETFPPVNAAQWTR